MIPDYSVNQVQKYPPKKYCCVVVPCKNGKQGGCVATAARLRRRVRGAVRTWLEVAGR